MANFPLEEFKNLLKDDRVYISIGKILKLYLAEDRSFLKCLCEIITEGDDRQIIARMTWDSVGPEAGDYQFPSVGDVVLICYVEGDDDMAVIIKRFSSIEDKIPKNAEAGDRVIKSLPEKNLWLTGQKKIILSKTDAQSSENLVLGQVFKKFQIDLLDKLIECMKTLAVETHTSSMPGYPTTPPTQAAAYQTVKDALNSLKSSPIEDEEILSKYCFTSKD